MNDRRKTNFEDAFSFLRKKAMQFTFATANEILFGPGSLAAGAEKISSMAGRVMIVTGRSSRRARALTDLLDQAGTSHVLFSVAGEPRVKDVESGAQRARSENVEAVVGFGGGSAMDSAKAVAALATNRAPAETYLEVIGQGKPLENPSLACIAVPTTAGTGSEVTRNAVLCSPDHGVKVSLRSPMMLPALAVVDPEMTYDLPPDITAATGCDALTQLMEAFVSAKATPVTDALCRQSLPMAAKALKQAFEDGNNTEARTHMSLAALFSGLALANGGLGAVHGIAGPLGGMLDAPHGALCAALLPRVFAANLAALTRGESRNPYLTRFAELARMLTGSKTSTAADGIGWAEELVEKLRIPPLGSWGLTGSMIPELAANAARASSMKGNPVRLSAAELEEIIRQSI